MPRGGARPGAGRPRKIPTLLEMPATDGDPLAFLVSLMNNQAADLRTRVDAARALLPYLHAKVGESGKKAAQASEAKVVARGKFAPMKPPGRLLAFERNAPTTTERK